MKATYLGSIARIAAIGAVTLFSLTPTNALADSFTVTYLGAGVQTPSASTTTNYETFDAGLGAGNTTTFNGSGITGTYSGAFAILAADEYGGAGGTGNFISTTTSNVNPASYTLTLSQNVNYFGFWFSALDNGNELTFEENGVAVYSFSPTNYSTLVGSCSGANAFCGNPNSSFLGDDGGQLYAYLNFLDTTGSFNSIVFTENPAVGQFESDNQAVANVDSIPGTPLTPTPEPSSFVLLGTGLLGAAGVLRRKFAK